MQELHRRNEGLGLVFLGRGENLQFFSCTALAAAGGAPTISAKGLEHHSADVGKGSDEDESQNNLLNHVQR